MDIPQSDWLRAFRIYFGTIAIGNLAWESLQLPLYTIWTAGTFGEQVFAVVHCTGGDMLIALAGLVVAMLPCPKVACTSGSEAPRSMAWEPCAWRSQ